MLTWIANGDAILDLYDNDIKRYIAGFIVTITDTGEQTEAALIARGDHSNFLFNHLGSLVIIQGPKKESDIDALLALHGATKVALARARSQALINVRKIKGAYAFSDFAVLKSSA